MGWRKEVFAIAVLFGTVTVAALAGEHEPPDFLAEIKGQSDSTTVLGPKFGIAGATGYALPFGSKVFKSDISRSQSFSAGIIWRTRLRKSHVLSYTPSLTFYYERLVSDHEAIVNRFRDLFVFPTTPYRSDGGDRSIVALFFDNLIGAPWRDRPVIPFARIVVGAGRYNVDALKVRWDNAMFTYVGYDDWIAIFGGGIGVMHDFEGRHFIALEIRAQFFGSLTEDDDYIDTHIGPYGPARGSSSPATIGLQLTAGVPLF